MEASDAEPGAVMQPRAESVQVVAPLRVDGARDCHGATDESESLPGLRVDSEVEPARAPALAGGVRRRSCAGSADTGTTRALTSTAVLDYDDVNSRAATDVDSSKRQRTGPGPGLNCVSGPAGVLRPKAIEPEPSTGSSEASASWLVASDVSIADSEQLAARSPTAAEDSAGIGLAPSPATAATFQDASDSDVRDRDAACCVS